MTKRPRYLTAKQLDIPVAVRDALIQLRRDLKSSKFEHRIDPDPNHPTKNSIFNMATWGGEEFRCGTAHCIGGWVDYYARTNSHRLTLLTSYFNLCYPRAARSERLSRFGMGGLTKEQAREAIANFLSGAKDPWSKVTPETLVK